MEINEYFEFIEKKVEESYAIANEAKKKGVDPVSKVEIPIATTLAEKAVGLISIKYPQIVDKKIINRINELEREHGSLHPAAAFKIAEEIAREKFCKFNGMLEAIDAGIRVGFAYLTLGVVSSPLEGYTELKLNKTRKGEDYFVAYFSGPIRSAGTTASCLVLMLIDYLRECFGFAKYDPDEKEVRRYVSENYDYHERVTNLQYLPTEEEIEFLAKNIPIQISGEPSEKKEVFNYKDLDRVETNFIRGGMCLIFSEGLAQKAKKAFGLWRSVQAKGLKCTGWEFLEEYNRLHEKREKGKADASPTYIKDLVAGRPVFGHPGRSGGFRFRYGRARTNGFSAVAVHPATMAISGDFLGTGTQLKIEKPTKGCTIGVCSDIDGPIVKLRNGEVRKINGYEEGRKVYPDVEEIVYFGDILFPFGDVANRNFELLKAGYVEEWHALEVEKAWNEKKTGELREIIGKIAENWRNKIEFEEAVEISRKLNVALHPEYIYYWREIGYDDFLGLVDWISHGKFDERLILPWRRDDRERFSVGKRALELIGCEHKVFLENIVLDEKNSKALLFNLGIENGNFEEKIEGLLMRVKEIGAGEILDIINELCDVKIKDKSGTFIGARMGRPEKAKLRKLTGSPHVLFPVGDEGGRLRSVQAAVELGKVTGEFPNYYCEKCKRQEIYPRCLKCGDVCLKSEKASDEKIVDIKEYFEEARKFLGLRNEEVGIVKGVRGTSSKSHSCENLVKGLLRAKYGLNVNKDGTIRYDVTEMPLTHFRAREIGTSVEKLRELGYEKDIYGNKLENEEQVVELFPHDIVLPACPKSLDEKADDVFLRIMGFVDDELEKIYGVKRFFNIKSREDLIGHLAVCIAPHICTATVARIIGFSKVQPILASPFLHAAMRRDADGDECAVMLLMDLLLNFSKEFLPAHRGGTQDAPLVLNSRIKAGDVDEQILDFELVDRYPLELYLFAEQGKHSSDIKVEMVRNRLKEGRNPFIKIGFTHECDDINGGTLNSSYKTLPSMNEKVKEMMGLCVKLRSVDTSDVARLVIERHFIRDIRGNLRKFSQQVFRCVACNSKYRRPPLIGKCTKCGGRIIFTISEGSILKYMQPALELARNYNASPYLLESLELVEMYIQSIFGKEKEKQEALGKWF